MDIESDEIVNIRSWHLRIKIFIILILCASAAGFGPGAYILLRATDQTRFNDQFDSAVGQIERHFGKGIERTQIAHNAVNNIVNAWLESGNVVMSV